MGAKSIADQAHKGGASRILLRPGSLRRGLLVLGACFLATCAQAQQAPAQVTPNAEPAMGSVHGTVESADGEVYEGASVELSRPGNPTKTTQQTDGSGAFNFANLPAGSFKITVSSAGFQTQSVSGELQAGEAYDARTIVLPMAASSNSVRVSAGSLEEIAEAQLNLEEQQRVLGMFPNYYVTYDPHAVALTSRQKFQLAWKISIDPVTWVMTGAVAGMEQAGNAFKGYGQGAQGYGKRFGAYYADNFDGNMIGGAILPSVFKQDPRYFYKGTGTITSRTLYAIANTVICKGDNGHWQPNYSGVLGDLAAGGISNLYYPPSNRSGVDQTFLNALIVTGEGAVQNLFQEFVVRRLTPHIPHYSTGTP